VYKCWSMKGDNSLELKESFRSSHFVCSFRLILEWQDSFSSLFMSNIKFCFQTQKTAYLGWSKRYAILTYFMEQSPSWEVNQVSASQEIPCIICNLKVHYRIHKCPLLFPILSTVAYRREGLRGSNSPSPRNSEGHPKSCQTQPDCENC